MIPDTPLAALRASKLAAELDDAQAQALAGVIYLRDLKQGEVLVREGTSDNHLYVVVHGTFGVVKNHGTPDAVTLNTLTNGDFMGELGFIDGLARYASLVALGQARVFGLEREALESLLPQHADVVYRVMRAIIRTVHDIQRRLSMQSIELANYIYKQHGRY
jgi:CRP/FNR family transcriptional regulator, cyclic AMP receptor protein